MAFCAGPTSSLCSTLDKIIDTAKIWKLNAMFVSAGAASDYARAQSDGSINALVKIAIWNIPFIVSAK